jgi:preprotein translocase subunit SecG
VQSTFFFFYSFFLCCYVVLHKKKNKGMMDYINGKVDNDTSF